MNRQKLFDKALYALRAQGVPCTDIHGDCILEDDEGRHCAIGHLLPPSILAKVKGGWKLPEESSTIHSYLKVKMDKDIQFLGALRGAHDLAAHHSDIFTLDTGSKINSNEHRTSFLSLFEQHMADVASRFKLKYEAP